MRHLRAAVFFLAAALSAPASADPCCPSGCVQDANRCVIAGTNQSCGPLLSCGGGGARSPGGSGGGTQTGVVFQRPLPPACFLVNPTPAAQTVASGQCVNSLSANAQLIGCFFEDDAGRAEDARTGLSCPARQSALANQCRNRCLLFVSSLSTCSDPNSVWQRFFGDISGNMVGSARVDLCGPPLRDSFFKRAGRLRPQRVTP